MQVGNWIFEPRPVPLLAALIALPVLLSLGFWQLQRADQKSARFEAVQARERLSRVEVNALAGTGLDPDALIWRQARAHGSFGPGRVYLLDNQVYQGRPGYLVFSILRLGDSGRGVLVNRGWVPAPPYRDQVPSVTTPEGELILSGRITAAPVTGRGSETVPAEAMANGMVRLQHLAIDALGRPGGIDLLPFVLRLDPGAPAGFSRDWPEPGSGRETNLGYAFQWFAMAGALLIIVLVVNSRRAESGP